MYRGSISLSPQMYTYGGGYFSEVLSMDSINDAAKGHDWTIEILRAVGVKTTSLQKCFIGG